MTPISASSWPWQRVYFYGALFWVFMGVMLFVENHLPATQNHSRGLVAVWQIGFLLLTAGYLIHSAPLEKRAEFSKFGKANGPLIFFFGPLTIPGYLWYWYGWKRALRFLLFTLVYFVAFCVVLGTADFISPGTF